MFRAKRGAVDTGYSSDGAVVFDTNNFSKEPAVLSALFFGFGLAKAIDVPVAEDLLREAAKSQYDGNIAFMLAQMGGFDTKSPMIIGFNSTPEYKRGLGEYLARDRRFLLAEVLEGNYVSHQRNAEIIESQQLISDAYLKAAKSQVNQKTDPDTELKLEGVSAEEADLCRKAFATLPDYVQRAITGNGITFSFAGQQNIIRRDGKKISVPHKWVDDAKTDGDTLPSIFLAYALPLIITPPEKHIVNNAAREHFFHGYAYERGIVPVDGKFNLTPAQNAEFQTLLNRHMSGPQIDRITAALEGGYRSRADDSMKDQPTRTLYDYYLGKTKEKYSSQQQAAYSSAIDLSAQLKLEGMTLEQQQTCRKAFATLPGHVQKVIRDAGVLYKATEGLGVNLRSDHVSIGVDSLNHENISKILPRSLLSSGLAMVLSPKVDASLIKDAGRELFTWMMMERLYKEGKTKSASTPLSEIDKNLRKRIEEQREATIGSASLPEIARDVISKTLLLMESGKEVPKAMQAVYDAYMAEAKRKAAAPLEATDKAFVMDRAALTTPQQEYFEHVNNIIAKLGMTPKEFDNAFRIASINQLVHDSTAVVQGLAKNISKKEHVKVSHVSARPDVDLALQEPTKQTQNHISVIGTPNNKTVEESISTLALQLPQLMYDAYLGCREAAMLESVTKSQGFGDFLNELRDKTNITAKAASHNSNPIPLKSGAVFSMQDTLLQRYATGQVLFSDLSKIKPTVTFNLATATSPEEYKTFSKDKLGGGYFVMPSAFEYFDAAMQHAIVQSAKAKNIDLKEIEADFTGIKKLAPKLGMSSAEYQKIAEQETVRAQREAEKKIAEDAARKAAEEKAARDAEERRQREEEEAKKPKPYVFGAAISGSEGSSLGKVELAPLGAAMDLRFDAHKKLADALFKPEILLIAEKFIKASSGEVRSLLDSGKNPRNAQLLKEAKAAVESFFSSSSVNASPEEKEATQKLRDQLLASPVFLALLLGKQKLMDDAERETGSDHELKRLLVTDEGAKAFLRLNWPELAALTLPPLPEKKAEMVAPPAETPPAEPTPIEPLAAVAVGVLGTAAIASVAANAPATVPQAEEPRMPPQGKVFTAITPAAAEAKASSEVAAAIQRSPEHERLYQQVFNQVQEDALPVLIRAKDSGYTQFKCSLGLKQQGYPIKLTFMNADGETLANVAPITIQQDRYKKAGIDLGLDDALDFKIAVQSIILNEAGITPIGVNGKVRKEGLGDEDYLPRFAYDSNIRNMHLLSNSGVISLQIKAPYKKDRPGDEKQPRVTLNIPLGVADVTSSLDDNIEALERQIVVLDFIEKRIGRDNQYITKGDVMQHLEHYVESQNKGWVKNESFKLEGFEKPRRIHTNQTQKVTMSPVTLRMEPGGDNPSWSANFGFSLRDSSDDDRSAKNFRGRAMELHTSNKDLAIARAKESLAGAYDSHGNLVKKGLLTELAEHCTAHPDDPWIRETGKDSPMIGSKPFDHFLDDMRRYEHDVAVQLSEPQRVGDRVQFTIRALRSVTPDSAGTVNMHGKEEVLKRRERGDRRNIEMTLSVPADKANRIQEFAESVSRSFGWTAAEAYSELALAADGTLTDQRKTPDKYDPRTIDGMFKKAIQTHFKTYFGLGVDDGTVIKLKEGGFTDRASREPAGAARA